MDDDGLLLSIGELARRSGLPVRTIRFWSDTGVLPPAERTEGGRRLTWVDGSTAKNVQRLYHNKA